VHGVCEIIFECSMKQLVSLNSMPIQFFDRFQNTHRPYMWDRTEIIKK